MKKTKEKKTSFKFWRENKLSQEFEMNIEELKNLYRVFLKAKSLDWIEYYGHRTVVEFITSPQGLNSVFDKNDYYQLETDLMDVRHEFYK